MLVYISAKHTWSARSKGTSLSSVPIVALPVPVSTVTGIGNSTSLSRVKSFCKFVSCRYTHYYCFKQSSKLPHQRTYLYQQQSVRHWFLKQSTKQTNTYKQYHWILSLTSLSPDSDNDTALPSNNLLKYRSMLSPWNIVNMSEWRSPRRLCWFTE